MNTQEYLEKNFQTKINPTGRSVYMSVPLTYDQYYKIAENSSYDIRDMRSTVIEEREIAIRMTESNYDRFMREYSQHVSIMEFIERDYEIRDMYYKMLTLIALKK